MSDMSPTVNCGNCGKKLDEDAHGPVDTRKPCPDCGSTARRFSEHLRATVVLRSKLGAKARHPDQRKPFHEQVVGADLQHKSGRSMHKERIIDRENDWYSEAVTDPETGEVIHECHEPLSKHQGHGSPRPVKELPGRAQRKLEKIREGLCQN